MLCHLKEKYMKERELDFPKATPQGQASAWVASGVMGPVSRGEIPESEDWGNRREAAPFLWKLRPREVMGLVQRPVSGRPGT